jgi:hypothetical protein
MRIVSTFRVKQSGGCWISKNTKTSTIGSKVPEAAFEDGRKQMSCDHLPSPPTHSILRNMGKDAKLLSVQNRGSEFLDLYFLRVH